MNISKNDIQKYYDDKQIKKKKTLRVMRLMKETAEKGKSMCMYVVPDIILGMPLYNINECVLYIKNILKDKGFESAYAEPNIILIFWQLENKLIKQKINQPRLENKIPQMYEQNNVSKQDNTKTVEYNSIRNISVPQTFFFNH